MNYASLKGHILQRLIYGEVFSHPVSREEIRALLPEYAVHTDSALDELRQAGLVHEKEGFCYILEEGDKILRRTSGSEHARRMLPKAQSVGQRIYRFPYVEGVGISGSLSKGVLHEDSDFDFFIVTRPGRLWIARTLLILYKKLFLLNSRQFFCVNYFVDTGHLEIEEKNAFTAMEIATLLPIAGNVMEDFFETNAWVRQYFRNEVRKPHFPHVRKPLFSRTIMAALNGRFGDRVDRQCMKITLRRWKRKFGDFAPGTFDLTMKSRPYISKHHPNNFQDKVLKRLDAIRDQYVDLYAEQLNQMGIRL